MQLNLFWYSTQNFIFNIERLIKLEIILFQFTEEKLGTSERTELDAHFENLAERSDATKLWTEKILSDTEAVLTPNPGLCT